jgi:hypothetical protein
VTAAGAAGAADAAAWPADSFDLEEMVAEITAWAEVESPSTDVAGVNLMMDLAAETMEHLGRCSSGDWGRMGRRIC